MQKQFLRHLNYDDFGETFLIASVFTIVAVRGFLKLTNYPQLGGNGLHIAHVLWGGLFLTLALWLSLFFLNNSLKHPTAFLGGVGFGLFVDELGKFLTSDNNYFFKPTFALIYLIFILMYLALRFLEKRDFTENEYLANSCELLKEIVVGDLDPLEQQSGIAYLKKCHNQNFTKPLLTVYQQAEIVAVKKNSLITQVNFKLKELYYQIINSPLFNKLLIWFFVLKAVLGMAVGILVMIGGIYLLTHLSQQNLVLKKNVIDIFDYVSISATALSTFYIILGIAKIRKSHLKAYIMFKRSLLISIFIEQFFAFYSDQLSAIFNLLINMVILSAVVYLIKQEQSLLSEEGAYSGA